MTVATFQQTDAATQPVNTYNANIDADFAVLTRLGVMFAPHAQASPNMTVRLDAGHIFNGTALTEVAAQSTGTITAPSTNPRIDRVVIDRLTGAVSVATGTEAASPAAPAIPAGKLPVAQIALQTSTTSITNALITDERDLDLAGVNVLSGTMPVVAQSGTNHTYVASNLGSLVSRSNSGTVMADTLPGTGTGVMAAGWSVTIANNDTSALMSVAPGSGATLKSAPLGYLVLGPGQQATVTSDGTDYYVATAPIRARLGANTTIYVSTAGSDSNTGLASGTAFLTGQKAVDVIWKNMDLAGYTLTVQFASGTYAGIGVYGALTGAGIVQLNGDTTTPSNCVIAGGASNAVNVRGQASLNIRGFKLTSTNASGLRVADGGLAGMNGNMEFGACSIAHFWAQDNANLVVGSNYSITGGAQFHILCFHKSYLGFSTGLTITLTGTPAFSNVFAFSNQGSIVLAESLTYTGAATGSRYFAGECSGIKTGGAANYFPGNAAGSVSAATFGYYV